MERPSKVAVPRPISSRMTRRAAGRLVQDGGGLDHLDHEGGAAARQIVGRADAAEQPVDDADMRRGSPARRSPSAPGCAISAFWRRKVDLPAMFGPVTSQSALALPRDRNHWRRSAGRIRAQRRLDHRMAAARDLERRAAVHQRAAHSGRSTASSASAAATSSAASAPAASAIASARARHLAHQIGEQRQLERQRLVGGVRDALFQLGQLDGGEAHGAGHGLAVDEALPRPSAACRRGWP